MFVSLTHREISSPILFTWKMALNIFFANTNYWERMYLKCKKRRLYLREISSHPFYWEIAVSNGKMPWNTCNFRVQSERWWQWMTKNWNTYIWPRLLTFFSPPSKSLAPFFHLPVKSFSLRGFYRFQMNCKMHDWNKLLMNYKK